MDDIADLQAQIVALRLAVEGVWLSVLAGDPNAVVQAERLRDANIASLDQLDTTTAQTRAARDAVALHTQSLWGSIVWQLQQHDTRG
jgi:hypothetical protein